MVWIASFPRSGNTFFRNLFFDVYGLESASFPREGNTQKGIDYLVTKTHLLPTEVPLTKGKDFVICLVRDGRDSVISNAHYHKNFISSTSDFEENIKNGILAPFNSHFGGWSKNVYMWAQKADLIIRFEELIQDPIYVLKQIEERVELPEGDYSKIKSFEELKNGMPRYGSGGKDINKKKFAQTFFNKGKVGRWKEEMPSYLLDLYWEYHGDVMEVLGYTKQGTINPFKVSEIKELKRKRSRSFYFMSAAMHTKYAFKKIKKCLHF